MAQKNERIRQARFMNMCMIEDGKGNVLVLNKINNSYTGVTFPGGHIEKGESYYDSIIREVREETGLLIEHPILTGLYHWEKDGAEQLVVLYRTDKYSGELCSSEEGQVYWIPKEEFLKQKLAAGMKSVWEIMHSETVQECQWVQKNEEYKEVLF